MVPFRKRIIANPLWRALKYFRPELPRFMLASGLLLLSTAANVFKPWPLAWIVDGLLGNKPLPAWLSSTRAHLGAASLLALLSLLILLLHWTQAALAAAENFLTISIGLRGLLRARQELFGLLQRLSLRFVQASHTGDLIYRASWDTYAIQTIFQQGVWTGLSAGVSLLLMIAIMARLNLRLTLFSLATVPLLLLVMRSFGSRMRSQSAAAHQADSAVTSAIQQTIVALPLIQSYTREQKEQQRFERHAEAALAARRSQHGSEIAYGMGIAFVFGLGATGLTWLGAQQVMAGRLSIGQLFIFLAYLAQLYEPLNQLSNLGSTVADACARIQRVFELLDSPIEVQEKPNARPMIDNLFQKLPVSTNAVQFSGNVAFDRVIFGYEPGRPVLHEVTFELHAGDSLALIGPSGAGKTTLLQLLPRFYDPISGTVRFEGADIRQLRLKDVRAAVAVVLQEPLLLPGTIADNIRLGKPDAQGHELIAASRAAHAEEFIASLPRQYETFVGEGGARLSVGEKQRLNLARAFLKNAPLLVLDEPTSSLDPESEALVIDSLRDLMHGRTTLVVAHRLSTLRDVTRILVLEHGRITENGTPAELARHDGYFSRLLRSTLERRMFSQPKISNRE